jgi:ABC-type phosphate transport system substrate-binding protein
MKRIALIAVLAFAGGAFAQTDGGLPTCDQAAAGSTSIYVGGSTALQPFVKSIGPALAAQSPSYTLFYTGGGSCVGVNNVLDATANPLATATVFSYYTASGATITENKCTLPTSQTQLDVAISDVFVETCTSAARPSGFGDFLGPAQSMVFVVPNGSDQTAITAEEAYIALGFGGKDQLAPPWEVDDPNNFFFIRNNKSGTQLILSGVIGVPAAKWKGFDSGGAGGVFTKLTAQTGTAAEKSIGIIGLDYLDQNDTDGTPRRSKVKMLALAAKGQTYAYFPDSTHNSYDKKNLREGRYAGLGYAHLVTPVGTDGLPTADKAKYLVSLLTGGSPMPAPSFDVTKLVVQNAHLVPLCAMKVQRQAEGGPLMTYHPAQGCGCYFESLVGTASSSCTSCAAGPSACGSGTSCRNGFCEQN